MKRLARLWKSAEDQVVRCFLCAHYCKIEPEDFGFCGVRQNLDGELFTMTYAEIVAQHVDPIEKKPLYHFLPGTQSYSIAAIGCNFRCGFCQNWSISQRSKKGDDPFAGRSVSPEETVEAALRSGSSSISYTYTEPTIFFEYAYDTARLAKEQGLANVFVTNGYMTPDAVDEIQPFLDAANVDLKAWEPEYYKRNCQARIQPVLKSIQNLKEAGVWVEVTTLVVPGENDTEEQFRGIAGFLAGVSPEIPWHISRFHPDYRFGSVQPTPVRALETALRIGHEAGLRYVYLGNLPGFSTTYCPSCRQPVVERFAGFREKATLKDGRCANCGAEISGVWDKPRR